MTTTRAWAQSALLHVLALRAPGNPAAWPCLQPQPAARAWESTARVCASCNSTDLRVTVSFVKTKGRGRVCVCQGGARRLDAASSRRTFVDSELQPPAFAWCSQRVKPHPRRRRHVSWLLARLVALVMFRDWLWLVPPFLLSYLCSLCFPRWPGYGKKEMERFGYAHSAYCPIHLLRQCVGFGCSSVARPTFANRE